ncbi:MAG: hypothetical protein AAGI46_10090 [Planctomycetota bacterium]
MAADTATPLAARPGKTFDVTITKALGRESARKTVERLFMSDPEFRAPIDARVKNHKDRPKRRGGRIYTKYTRKVHPDLPVGASAKISATTQHARDLASVASFVEVK